MSTELTIPDNFGAVPEVFRDAKIDNSRFTSGIGMAWPILTLKGKSWGWRFRGQDHIYTAPDASAGGAQMPIRALELVLVDAGSRISKVYYKAGFKDGERTPPDCWSADGITPDEGSAEKQANTCRGCPHNVFGTGAEGKGKACSDNKRLAVVPLSDLKNTDFGGPFMLRLPPGSFANYTTYVSVMASRGYQPYMIVTRMMFDPSVAHPKVLFMPVRVLSNEEALIVKAHQDNPRTTEMLNDKAMAAFADAEVEAAPVGALPGPGAAPEWNTAPAGPAASSVPTTAPPADQLEIPAVLVRTSAPVATPAPATAPALTPAQQRIADLEAQLAAAKAPPEPEPPKVVLTPEQLRIQELEAQLAAVQTAKKPGRPRSKPVAPPEATATTAAAPVTQPGNGAAPPENPPSAVGNAIADRIAGLVGKTS